MDNLGDGLRWIKKNLIDEVMFYFERGVFHCPTNDTYIKGYNIVYEFADIGDNGREIYDYYVNSITEYTSGIAKGTIMELKDEALLTEFVRRWENHKILVYWMSKTFTYLDRYHVQNTQCLPLSEAGLVVFKNEIFNRLQGHLKSALILEVFKEREGQFIDRQRMKESLRCFAQMGMTKVAIRKVQDKQKGKEYLSLSGNPDVTIYNKCFETAFIEDSSVYYTAKSAGWISNLSCPEFLKEAKRAIESEEKRADRYLEASTKSKLLNIVVQEVVNVHAAALTEMEVTGCLGMFKQDKRDELKLMYEVFKSCEKCFDHMSSKLQPFIEQRGLKIVSDKNLQQDPLLFTRQLLEFKADMDSMVAGSFDSNSKFQRCRDTAFQNFMNKCQYSAAHIAAYCDNEMRKGLKGANEDEVESRLEALTRLFVCLNDRDVFIKHYTRLLSKRLLDNTSINDDAEQRMIKKLTVECGHNIVNKINNMYQDINLSQGIMKNFKKLAHRGAPAGFSLEVNVIRNGCWPEQSTESCQMPIDLLSTAEDFKQFYLTQHTGRNLILLLSLGNLELGYRVNGKSYFFIVNPYQASILFLFNMSESYTVSQIQNMTQMEEKVLTDNLTMFFNPKHKLFNKPSKGKILNKEDEISLNSQFRSTHIKVDYRPKKVVKSEHQPNQEDEVAILTERKNVLDSIIVRIAKTRRLIKHADMISEVMKQVHHFKPQPSMIKGQIESLIQREFLCRDENDRGKYHYIP